MTHLYVQTKENIQEQTFLLKNIQAYFQNDQYGFEAFLFINDELRNIIENEILNTIKNILIESKEYFLKFKEEIKTFLKNSTCVI